MERILHLLQDAGFNGTVILEVTPDGFLNDGGYASLEYSVKKLKSL